MDFIWVAILDLGTQAWWDGASWVPGFTRQQIPVSLPGGQVVTWSYDFDPAGAGGTGTYQAFARAQDVQGDADANQPQAWFVLPAIDASAPQTLLDTPVSGASVAAPVGLSGSVSDDSGVEFVWVAIVDIVTQAWWDGASWVPGYLRQQIAVSPAGAATLAPDFAITGHFYIYYTDDVSSRARLTRFAFTGSASDLSSETIIWESPSKVINEQHLGGGLAFGADGNIYLALGDNFNPLHSQDLTTVWGTVIRIAPDGSIPIDNPFADGPGPFADEIFAFGVRSPFRLSVSPAGTIRLGDVGGNVQLTAVEELNEIVAAANYGWPNCEGPCALPGVTGPWHSYPHDGVSASVIEGFTYTGQQLPGLFTNTSWYGDYSREEVRYLVLDQDGGVLADRLFLPSAGSVVWLGPGPGGAIYRIDLTNGSIHRTIFDQGNRVPQITSALATPEAGPAPLTVNYVGTASDPELDALTYRWILDDGTVLTGADVSYDYAQPGFYAARLEVADATHAVYSAPIEVNVGGAPSVSITAPLDGSLFRAGDPVIAIADASDPDESLNATNYSWSIDFGHNEHFHPVLGPITGTSIALDVPTSGHDFSDDTFYRFKVTVTDSDGLAARDEIVVLPDKAVISLDSNVAGIQVSVDAIAHPMPFEFDDVIDFTHTVSVPATVCIDNVLYTFGNWSSGAARDDLLVVPDGSLSDFATYTPGSLCDTSAPDTTIDYPPDFSTIPGPVTIQGQAFDDLGLVEVRVRLLDRETDLWWDGSIWQPLQKSFIVHVDSPGMTTSAWSYFFDVYNITPSREFFVDARAVDGFGNVDISVDTEFFTVEPPP